MVLMDTLKKWLGTAKEQAGDLSEKAKPMVEKLLRNKEDKYHDYSRENLEAALASHFEVRERLSLESGNRFLYWCSRRS